MRNIVWPSSHHKQTVGVIASQANAPRLARSDSVPLQKPVRAEQTLDNFSTIHGSPKHFPQNKLANFVGALSHTLDH